MTKTAINDYISTRGVSGSSRGATLIREAFAADGSASARTLSPRRRPTTRVGRLAQMLTWDFLEAPREAARLGADAIVHTTNTGRGSRRLKSVVVMHDTMVLDHPRLFNKWFVLYARLTFNVSARTADLIVTPSAHSASRIAARWPRSASRVRVIPWPAPDRSSSSRDQSQGSRPFSVLVVASMDKHKRLGLAVEVVARLREMTGTDVRLDMVVRAGNDDQAVVATVDAFGGQWVRMHRGVSEPALAELYESAGVTLVPSLDEGYCLPAVESIARGTPVVHAGRGALPEVVPMYPAAHEGQDDFTVLLERLEAVRVSDVASRQLDEHQANSENFAADVFRSRWLRVIDEVKR